MTDVGKRGRPPGNEYNGIHYVAMYWKNGSPVILSDGAMNGDTRSIFVSGNDVYVVGREFNGTNYLGKYWKNARPVILTDSSKGGDVTSIFLK